MLSPQGVLLDGNAMSPDSLDLHGSAALGKDFWDAVWWSWSPVVQERLRAAIALAGSGEVVRYDETMRIRGNRLITTDITLAPLLTADRVSTIVCSILDVSQGHRADVHWTPPPSIRTAAIGRQPAQTDGAPRGPRHRRPGPVR